MPPCTPRSASRVTNARRGAPLERDASSDPDQVNDAINDGASAPTAKSICDALGIEAITTDVFRNVSLQGC